MVRLALWILGSFLVRFTDIQLHKLVNFRNPGKQEQKQEVKLLLLIEIY